MYQKMLQKRNQKGFTLMEMLIVVAIIAILVAVSIPVFTSQLTRAKEAADNANVRAAKAVAVSTYLTDPAPAAKTVYYDAAAGTLKDAKTGIAGYCKGTTGGLAASGAADDILEVKIDADGGVVMAWVKP